MEIYQFDSICTCTTTNPRIIFNIDYIYISSPSSAAPIPPGTIFPFSILSTSQAPRERECETLAVILQCVFMSSSGVLDITRKNCYVESLAWRENRSYTHVFGKGPEYHTNETDKNLLLHDVSLKGRSLRYLLFAVLWYVFKLYLKLFLSSIFYNLRKYFSKLSGSSFEKKKSFVFYNGRRVAFSFYNLFTSRLL